MSRQGSSEVPFGARCLAKEAQRFHLAHPKLVEIPSIFKFRPGPDALNLQGFHTATPITQEGAIPAREELVSVPFAGGPVLKHHPDFPLSRQVADYLPAPDGLSVIYRADQDQDDSYDLYYSITGR